MTKYLGKLSDRQVTIFTALAGVLFFVDILVPDPIPFVDEGLLLYALLLGLREVALRRNVALPGRK